MESLLSTHPEAEAAMVSVVTSGSERVAAAKGKEEAAMYAKKTKKPPKKK
jgi:hypothetical protein